jgi:hypothetical protein
MASFRKHGNVWYYRFVDADGVKRERKGCPDRRVTKELARAAESEASKIRQELIDSKALRLAQAAREPIAVHIDDFIAAITQARRNEQHICQTRRYVTRLCELGRIERLPDLILSAIVTALGRLRDEEKFATRTIEAYATAAKSFSRRRGRTAGPLTMPSTPWSSRAIPRTGAGSGGRSPWRNCGP